MVELFVSFLAYTAQCWRDLLLIPEKRLLSGQHREIGYMYRFIVYVYNIFTL